MESLPPIPTPFEQRWREFKIQVLPVVVFICVVTGVVYLWRGYIQPVGMVGEVESIRATAGSHLDGVLVNLTVDRFDLVKAGQELGEVMTADPELVKASVASVQSELLVLQVRMRLDDQRREFDFQGLWYDLMVQKIDLASNQALLVQATNELARSSALKSDGIDSGTLYDLAKAQADSLRAQIIEQTRLIENLSVVVDKLRFSNDSMIQDPINEAIKAKEQEVEALMKPVKLVAPIDGEVSGVFRRPGEKVTRGEPIITITSTQSDHIVGYMRQPLDRMPEVNASVQVITRGRRRLKGEGQVLHVGSSLEPLTNSIMGAAIPVGTANGAAVELALPVLISIPPELKDKLRPGESVDLALMAPKKVL